MEELLKIVAGVAPRSLPVEGFFLDVEIVPSLFRGYDECQALMPRFNSCLLKLESLSDRALAGEQQSLHNVPSVPILMLIVQTLKENVPSLNGSYWETIPKLRKA